jgi:hypothetical protein
VGLAGVAVGTVFGVLTLTNRSQGHADCPNANACKQSGVDAYDRARTFRTVSDVGWAVAIAGIGAGAVLYLTSRHSPKEMALAVHVEPASAGLSFSHAFEREHVLARLSKGLLATACTVLRTRSART